MVIDERPRIGNIFSEKNDQRTLSFDTGKAGR